MTSIRVRERELEPTHCVYCHGDLGEEPVGSCAECRATHHGDCLRDHGRCAACGREPFGVRQGAPAFDARSTPDPAYAQAGSGPAGPRAGGAPQVGWGERTPPPGYGRPRRYRFWVFDPAGREHTFELTAQDREHAGEIVRRRGLVAIRVELVDGLAEEAPARGRPDLDRDLTQLALVLLLVVLAVLAASILGALGEGPR